MELKTATESARITNGEMWTEILGSASSIALLGSRGSGKTSFDFYLSQFTAKPIYIVKYPKVELLPKEFRVLPTPEDIRLLTDSFIIWDEPQMHIDLYEKKANRVFMKILSLMRQNDNTLITSTSDSRFYTRGLESYIDAWVIKDIDFETLKQGSKASKIIKRACLISPNDFKLRVDEYVLDGRNWRDYFGVHRFRKAPFWTESMSFAFKGIV